MSWTAIVAVPLVLTTAAVVVAATTRRSHAARRTSERGRAEFDAQFHSHGATAEVLAHTYDALHRRRGRPVIRAGDELADTFGLSRLDVEDLALVVIARCGGRIPSASDLDDLGTTVRSVDDLVAYVMTFCRVEELA